MVLIKKKMCVSGYILIAKKNTLDSSNILWNSKSAKKTNVARMLKHETKNIFEIKYLLL